MTIPGFSVATSVELRGPRGRAGQIDLGDVRVSGLTVGGIDDDFESSQWWIDPLVGARLGVGLSERVRISVFGDVGGFGIGSASSLSWQVAGLLGYRLNERWTLAAGYRAIALDRGNSTNGADLVMHGPILSTTWHFWP